MFGFIIADLKRALKTKGTRLYLIGTAGLILLANIAVICFRFIYGSNEGTFSYNVFEYASWCFLIPYYSCILIGIIAYGSKYIKPEKNGIKAECGGKKTVLAPWQMFVAKLAVAILLACVFLVAAFVLLYVITTVFHLNEGFIIWGVVKSFLSKAALSLPLWFAGISFAITFLFIFEERWKAYAAFAIVTVIIPQLIRIFSLDTFKSGLFRTLRIYTITQSFGLIPYPSYPERSVPLIITLGLVYGMIAVICGIAVYEKKAA